MTAVSEQQTESIVRALRGAVRGEVRFDSFSRVLYSTDASIYQIMPVGVVIPRDEEDIVATLHIAAEERVPVLPRGGGTSLAGQSIGAAIILDCSKYMDRLLEVNPAGPWARVQPGVVQDELNIEVRQYDLRLGPDTATSNRATLGGMTGNNSAGARSIVYGKMVDHTLEIRTLCMDGTELTLQPLSGEDAKKKLASTSREGEIYRAVSSAVNANRDEIDRRFPKILRRVSGYNLDALLNDPTDLRKLIVGSEGTLGIVTEMKVRLVPNPRHSALNVVHFADLFEALEATQIVLQFNPSAVELIDRMVLEMTRAQLEHARRMTFVQGDPDALLLVEFSGDDREELQSRLAAMESALRSAGKGYAFTQAHSPAD
ncbi:MAG: FAD-binding oxidoreductase, partial [Candidatus Binataceae bacterium]